MLYSDVAQGNAQQSLKKQKQYSVHGIRLCNDDPQQQLTHQIITLRDNYLILIYLK